MDRAQFLARLPKQHAHAVVKASDVQRYEFFKKIEEGFELREIGSQGGFLLRKGSSYEKAEYCWINAQGIVQ